MMKITKYGFDTTLPLKDREVLKLKFSSEKEIEKFLKTNSFLIFSDYEEAVRYLSRTIQKEVGTLIDRVYEIKTRKEEEVNNDEIFI